MIKFCGLFLFFCVLPVLFIGCGAVEKEPAREQAVPVEVYTISRGEIVQTLSFVGDVRGRSQVEVHPKVSGKLKRYEVREGDMVERNSVIALIDRDVTGYDFAPAPVESPIAGLVAKLYPDSGGLVSPQVPVAVIADVEKVVVRVGVGESDYPSVKEGQIARVRVDAFPGKEFSGTVTRLSRLIDPMTRSAAAEVTVQNPDRMLVPGMFARMEIITGEREALLAAVDAIVRLPGTGSRFSYLVEDGTVRRVRVRTGAASGGHVEVISGLNEGDRVVVSGHGILEDGARVKVVEGL